MKTQSDALAVPSNNSQPVDPGIGARAASDALVASPENLDPGELLDRIRERGHLVLRVVGGSMGPWFVPGDLIVVQQVKARTVRRGEVVVFVRDSLLIAHRVINVLGAGPTGEMSWKTKGDSAERYDPPVFERELIGRVTSIERAGRSFSLQSPGWAAAGSLLAFLSPLSWFTYPVARLVRRLFKASQ